MAKYEIAFDDKREEVSIYLVRNGSCFTNPPEVIQLEPMPYNEHDAEKQYLRGLYDLWECMTKIAFFDKPHDMVDLFGCKTFGELFTKHTPDECIEKIRAYEEAQNEQEEEKTISAVDVMRQYLNIFCNKHSSCIRCPLYNFSCGCGTNFLSDNPMPNEEVRRAYAEVLKNMSGE